ncbi:MAG: helix-turn-helix domain-containing protein [Verrucomicrobiales bacterium]|jgi:transcriptional regulator with XRE-family HTH domain|nr:helix-turn-helix domain-containing protein [Verrucomicrobiales bacterium]
MTLSQKLKTLREKQHLSLAEIAKKTKLERTTIWKAENGERPRGSTLQKLCLHGYGIAPISAEWKEIQALWVTESTGTALRAQDIILYGAVHEAATLKESAAFRRALAKLTDDQWRELSKAVTRPTVMEALAALNRLFEAH